MLILPTTFAPIDLGPLSETQRPMVIEDQEPEEITAQPKRISRIAHYEKKPTPRLAAAHIDSLYENQDRLHTEQSLFYFLDGTPVVVEGTETLAESSLLSVGDDADTCGVQDLTFYAHTHSGSPIPSQADLEILIAKATLTPGEIQSHTILGYEDGERAFIEITCQYNAHTQTHSIDLKSSHNVSGLKLFFAKSLAEQGAHKMGTASTKDLQLYAKQKAATEETQENDYEQRALSILYEAHPYLPKAFENHHWNREQIMSFFNFLLQSASEFADEILERLPKALEQLAHYRITHYESVAQLLQHIISRAYIKAPLALDHLPKALAALQKIDLTDEERLEILMTLAAHGNESLYFTFDELLGAIEALNQYHWEPRHSQSLLLLIAKKTYPTAHESYTNLKFGLAALQQTSWSEKRKRAFIMFVTNKAHNFSSVCYFRLQEFINLLNVTSLNEEQKYDLLRTCIFHGGHYFSEVIKFITVCLDQVNQDNADHFTSNIRRLFKALNDHNFGDILNLLHKNASYFCMKTVSAKNEKILFDHLSLFSFILEKWPCSGFNILEGLFDALDNSDLKPPLTEHRSEIVEFIRQTNGFNPAIFNAYLKAPDKDVFYAELKTFNQRILADDFDLTDVNKIKAQYGIHGSEFLLGIIQITSPVSGLSNTPKEDQILLMEEMIARGGDMRDRDIPKVWRKTIIPFVIDEGKRKIKDGITPDASGNIAKIVGMIKIAKHRYQISIKDLAEKMGDLIMAPNGHPRAQAREIALTTLMTLVGQFEDIVERVESLEDDPYKLLIFLEHFFGNKDGIAIILADSLNLLPEEIFHFQIGYQDITNPARLARSINKTWKKYEIPEAERAQIIANMLAKYDPENIENEVLEEYIEDPELRSVITRVMFEAPKHSKKKITQDFLTPCLEIIQAEKNNYEYQVAHQRSMSVRPVKGPAYCLNGVTSGICTDKDIDLWMDPQFKLFAIVNDDLGVVVGYVYGYEVLNDGKLCLTLPGINPSDEFLAVVKPNILYQEMIKQMISLAKMANYAALYIPTDPNLSSNHGDIRSTIKRSHKKIQKFKKPVRWNTLPEPYPFNEVYVVWEKDGNG
jgi:hypothetical protein